MILKDKYTAAFFGLSLLVLAIAFAVAYVNLADSDGLLVIHFDAYKGADFFGNVRDVFDILITALVILVVNMAIAHRFYYRERLLSYLISATTLILMVLILIGVNVIISIN